MSARVPMALGKVIASRRLRADRDGRNTLIVRLGKPRRRTATEWWCPYHISGLGMRRVQRGVGGDWIQAVLVSLASIHRALEDSGQRMTWEYGDPGITGFAPIIPHFMGSKFFRKVDRMIADELWRWAEAKGRVPKRKRSTGKRIGKRRGR